MSPAAFSSAPSRAGAPTGDFEIVASPPAWRAGEILLKAVSRGGLVVLLGLVIFSQDPPTNPLRQLRLFAGLFLAPELAAWCIARAFAAKARVEDGALVIDQSQGRTEIPVSAIAAVEPWPLPLPRPGLSLRLRSGRLYSQGISRVDAGAFVEALVAGGASEELRAALEKPAVVYARARAAVPRNFFEHPLLKFGVYGMVPAFPAFRLHQFITYGGTFGEWYTYGPQAWLLGLALWWVSYALGLLYIAAGIRALVELLCFAAAAAAPRAAVGVRRFLEYAQRLFYYVGIPTWLLLRFTA